MKKQELRIGNLVHWSGEVDSVFKKWEYTLDIQDLQQIDENFGKWLGEHHAILLNNQKTNEEWLTRLGFEIYEAPCWGIHIEPEKGMNYDVVLFVQNDKVTINMRHEELPMVKIFDSVHELQNFMYYTFDKELEVKKCV